MTVCSAQKHTDVGTCDSAMLKSVHFFRVQAVGGTTAVCKCDAIVSLVSGFGFGLGDSGKHKSVHFFA